MKLCLTLAEVDPHTLQEQLHRYSNRVDLIEVRLDYLGDGSIPRLPTSRAVTCVATCRPPREGGLFSGSEAARLTLLRRAAEAGFDFVDLEHDVPVPARLPVQTRIIRSRHIFESLPPDFRQHLPKSDRPGDLSKLALTVKNTEQALQLLDWMEALPADQQIVIGMGKYGQITRYLGGFLGNCWTYVYTGDQPVAPGQFSFSEACHYFAGRIARGWESPPIYGVLGTPLGHSLSPRLHNFLFQLYGIPGVYLPLEIDNIETFLDYAVRSSLDFSGFSVTMPHKLAAGRWLSPGGLLQPNPRPVNTLIRQADKWTGLNTDREGFLGPLEQRIPLAGCRVVVLGTGGVARTVVQALKSRHAEILVVGRRSGALDLFGEQFGCETLLWSKLPVRGQALINATPVGQSPHQEESPWPGNSLDFKVVYDLIYRPRKTRLLALAESAGAQIISGMEMFTRQAGLQFLAWTGVEPDLATMETALTEPSRKEEL